MAGPLASWLTLTASAVRARDGGGLLRVLLVKLRDVELVAVRSVTAVPCFVGSDVVPGAVRVDAAPSPPEPRQRPSEEKTSV